MAESIFFNAQHSPIGAFASFTLGCKGARGGLGLEIGKPADESLYIGLQSRDGRHYDALPFFAGAEDDAARRFDVEGRATARTATTSLRPYRDSAIRRRFTIESDVWQAGDLTFTIHSRLRPAPDPEASGETAQKMAYVPAVPVEIKVDNRRGRRARTLFFGYSGNDPYSGMRRLDDTLRKGLRGVGVGLRTAVCSDGEGVISGTGFSIEDVLTPNDPDNRAFALGRVGALLVDVPAGECRTYRFVVCFYRGGIATAGIPSRYLYTRWFDNIESVATYALRHFDALFTDDHLNALEVKSSRLGKEQRFMLAHAINSYYGSTELLDIGTPLWVVNEGEYRMMNTFDLTVDQLYFELLLNPWTVRNTLDTFIERYSYRDQVSFPGESKAWQGGISFTHDMGVANVFSRPGHSSYEKFGLTGCFSHMTHEQLVNWVCCASAYIGRTRDRHWFQRHERIFRNAFTSLCRRDHPDPRLRDGVMSLDSSRCRGGAEITTYDSLDPSLGQARRNLYLAVKTWAAYAMLAACFKDHGDDRAAARFSKQARRASDTIAASADANGLLPALLDEGLDSRIIPAVEGLALPWFAGWPELVRKDGPYGELISALERHLRGVLRPGVCLFPDGGWKLSSTSDNSWLSKIYLCQFVAREILGLRTTAERAMLRRADAAHRSWLTRPENAYWAWSDQMVDGTARGSKYYPRGVTAILWTLETD